MSPLLEIGQQEKSVYVYSRIAVATTPNDIPRLRLCVRLRDNLLAFLLGHFRCIGTIEKFSLYKYKNSINVKQIAMNQRLRVFQARETYRYS